MFGGLPGVGADTGWYTTSLQTELAMLQNVPVVGGALDLFKCFDQVIRGLLYVLLLCSGLPATVVSAYSRFQEQTKVYNSIAGSLGQAHTHHCGIPQGCPLSMVFITFFSEALDYANEATQSPTTHPCR